MTWLATAGIAAGSVMAMFGVIAAAWRIVRRLVHLQDVLMRIESRSAELVPNGGGSLKDAVNRIERQVNELTARFEEHISGGGVA